jgi:hypothetical protein
MKAGLYLYALHCIHSTHDNRISFTSEDIASMHSFIHFPPSTNVDAYEDAVPPKPTNSSTLLVYSDACWGAQVGSTVLDGTLLPLFKFHSIKRGIIFQNGRGCTGEFTSTSLVSLLSPQKINNIFKLEVSSVLQSPVAPSSWQDDGIVS